MHPIRYDNLKREICVWVNIYYYMTNSIFWYIWQLLLQFIYDLLASSSSSVLTFLFPSAATLRTVILIDVYNLIFLKNKYVLKHHFPWRNTIFLTLVYSLFVLFGCSLFCKYKVLCKDEKWVLDYDMNLLSNTLLSLTLFFEILFSILVWLFWIRPWYFERLFLRGLYAIVVNYIY